MRCRERAAERPASPSEEVRLPSCGAIPRGQPKAIILAARPVTEADLRDDDLAARSPQHEFRHARLVAPQRERDARHMHMLTTRAIRVPG